MADPQPGEPAHVELRAVSKRFGSTQAVDRADISIGRGCIHALVGENGAGKSTVGKIIAGVYTADSGSMIVNGRVCRFRSPRQAFTAGITAIAQELALVPDRSVADNVFLGVESTRWGFVPRNGTMQRFEVLVERAGIPIDPAARVGSLSVADQQRVEILRAAARRSELVIMDEPSARLSAQERDQLHRLVRSLRDQRITVLFISHFLDEVLELADAITVMRDGRVVKDTRPSSETTGSLVEAMIGRKLEGNFPPKPPLPERSQAPVLRVRDLIPAGPGRADVCRLCRAARVRRHSAHGRARPGCAPRRNSRHRGTSRIRPHGSSSGVSTVPTAPSPETSRSLAAGPAASGLVSRSALASGSFPSLARIKDC